MDAIFVLQGARLTELNAAPYESEPILQKLLADYPELLAGEQIDPDSPRRWILISRELAVPDEEGGSGRWALDHLFLDQEGIPTLIEVKRASDTRIRREVVGQMLDYAANGSVYWPVEGLRDQFAARCGEKGVEPELELQGKLGITTEVSAFWAQVRDNLAVGRLRLVFVADKIPAELQRIIEFLNDQMTHATVIGLEVKQYVGDDGLKTLVPRIIGNTSQAREVKGQTETATYGDDLAAASENVQQAASLLFDWAKAQAWPGFSTRAPGRTQFAGAPKYGKEALFGVNPRWKHIQFLFIPLTSAGLTGEAAALTDLLSQLAHKPVSSQYPQLPCDALVENWDRVRDEFLPKYLAARERAAAQAPSESPVRVL